MVRAIIIILIVVGIFMIGYQSKGYKSGWLDTDNKDGE